MYRCRSVFIASSYGPVSCQILYRCIIIYYIPYTTCIILYYSVRIHRNRNACERMYRVVGDRSTKYLFESRIIPRSLCIYTPTASRSQFLSSSAQFALTIFQRATKIFLKKTTFFFYKIIHISII